MRKFSIVFAFAALVLLLVACGANASNAQMQTVSDTTPQSAPTERDVQMYDRYGRPRAVPAPQTTPVPPVAPDIHTEQQGETAMPPLNAIPQHTPEVQEAPVEEQSHPNEVSTNEDTDGLLASESSDGSTLSAEPLSQEDAEQLGTRYILDVFGTDIGNMYVIMELWSHPYEESIQWLGMASTTPLDDITRHRDRIYRFTIDGITGERIAIAYNPTQIYLPELTEAEFDAGSLGFQRAMDMGFFEMSITEQLAMSDITPEALVLYRNTAMDFAHRHLEHSSVADVQLVSISPGLNGIMEVNGNYIANITTLSFVATDNTGREIVISISAETASSGRGMVNIQAR